MKRKGLFIIGTAGLALAAYVRRQGRRWGATDAEFTTDLPGDDVIADAMYNLTHAVTIPASPAEIWPWLVQMGFGRAGWYTDSWLSPVEHRFWQLTVPAAARDPQPFQSSANRLLPEFQDLAVGDIILDGPPDTAYYVVTDMQPERHLVLRGHNHLRYMTPAPLRKIPALAGDGAWSWAFVLRPAGDGSTRLLMRTRAVFKPALVRLLSAPLIYVATFLNIRQMLLGIKARVMLVRPAPIEQATTGRSSPAGQTAVDEEAFVKA